MKGVLDAHDPSALARAAKALDEGGLVVFPTDTVYGIAARVDRPQALRELFEAKLRSHDLALPVLVADVDMALRLGVLGERARRLASAFWPGPLTIVVARRTGFAAALGGDGKTVGLRVPGHPMAIELISRTGPLATSSANRSTEASPHTIEEAVQVFGDAVALYLDAAPAPNGKPSTVVSVAGKKVEILRAGALSEEEIRAALE